MTQYVCYFKNKGSITAAIAQANPEQLHTDENSGRQTLLGYSRTSPKLKGAETVCVIDELPYYLSQTAGVNMLGEVVGTPYESAISFYTPEDQATYERVTGVLDVVEATDPEGNSIAITKPYLIGVLAMG